MSLIIASVAVAAAALHWYLNRHKTIKHILKELKHDLDTQGAGLGGLIDDWWNKGRNNIQLPDATRRIAIVTGGARGIGTEVVRGLLKANMTVVIGIRRPKLAEQMAKNFENGGNLQAVELDLQSLKSVKSFAENILKKYTVIHLLVNNAGIMFGDYKLTEDGFESQLAVNHLGHFYLTHLLLPALKRGGSIGEFSRVVNVTSCAHHPGTIYFDDINMKKYYDSASAYFQSKLAQLMSARCINKLMEEENSPVRCYSVHPGIVKTDLFNGTMFQRLFPWAMDMFFKTPEKGAVSILYGCFEKSLDKQGGLYISNCREGISNSFSKNVDNQRRLHELSCKLIGVDVAKYGKDLS
ncbi:hypothetical protein JYU34_021408 [Plutella xylostella]|uniref:Uncharacterized protein n=1 Tax=Plutella xylostella TaxID=51655 RepID=A0ABQ7PUU9_PLUXY|nr:hypothetical protein JYU34_021408 [Plutella xylostella]